MDETMTLVPIPIESLCDRYQIDPHTGVVYDMEQGTEVPISSTLTNDGGFTVELVGSDGKQVFADIEDLVIRTNFGDVGSSTLQPIADLPCKADLLIPMLESLRWDEDVLYLNDIPYHCWRGEYYYVSARGSVFSLKQNQWLRLGYDSTGTAYVSTKVDGIGRTHRVPRMVWETFRGHLDPMDTVVPANNRNWDSRLENLQIISRTERRAIQNPDRFHLFSDDEIRVLREELLSSDSNRSIANRHNLPIDYIWKLRTGRIVLRGLEGVGEQMKNRGRDKPLTPDRVREIRRLKNTGVSVKEISTMLGIGTVTIYQILQGKTYKDVV